MGYRLGRVIAYVDPDYSKIELIDTHHWVRNYVHQLHLAFATPVISRANPKSR